MSLDLSQITIFKDRQDLKYFTNDFLYKQFGHVIIDPARANVTRAEGRNCI